MKKVISVILLLLCIMSVFSCGIKEEGKESGSDNDDVKYKDGALKYVTLPDYEGQKITVNMDAIQMTIDQYLMNTAKDYQAKNGDDVYVDIISVHKVKYITGDDGKNIDTEGEEITELEGERLIENLGSGSYFKALEIRVIGLKIGDKLTQKITIPNDFKIEKYRGEEVFIEFKFSNIKSRRGDVVDVDYTGYYIDENNEIVMESGEKKSFDKGTSTFYLGSHMAIDDFEEGLQGMKVGETKQFFSTFPEDYGNEELNGKKVIFECKLNSIKQPDKYDDDFVKTNYGYETVEEFEQSLADGEKNNAAISQIIENIKINETPEKEYQKIVDEVNRDAENFEASYDIKYDKYLELYMGMTREQYIEGLLKSDLTYYAIAEKAGISISDEEFTKGKKEMIEYYQNLYMEDYDLNEEQALESATRYVNESVKESGIIESLLFEKVRQHIYKNTVFEIKERTYTSVSRENV